MAIKDKFFSWFGKGKKPNEDEAETVETPNEDVTQTQTSDTQTSDTQSKSESEPKVEQPLVDPALQTVEIAPEQDEMTAMFDEAATTGVENDETNEMPGEVTAPSLAAEPESAREPELELKPALEPEQDEMDAMFDEVATADIDAEADIETEEQPEVEEETGLVKKEGFFARLKKGLSKTKTNLGSGFVSLFRGKKIDDELFEDLETQLLIADVGVETSVKLVESLTKHASRKQLKDAEALYDLLKQEMTDLLGPVEQPIEPVNPDGPYVILMVGVNGVGKTTTIGKMAKQFQEQGKSVMLAAGDTFRAAAVEQLTVWGDRNGIPVVAQHTGADSASVIFDAIQSAKTRNIDVIIADTAGRLQNKEHLMEELKKIVRVMKKLDVNAPHEVMLTLDAGTGQNALSQVNLFSKAVGLTGLTISKLDGTAKGGVVFAIADKFSIPIRYIGVGEGIDDLRAFNSKDFIDALFSHDE
jgi:fused signal recognition particle receptor